MDYIKGIALSLLISLIMAAFSVKSAEAGISLGKGGITLAAGQTIETCDVWIYATQEDGTYHVETTGDLKALTASITPNDFTLDTIQCPEEKNARRACITQQCLSGNQSSCRIVCVKFTAPMLFELNPQETVYSGAILNTIKISAATIKEPYEFSVHVVPIDIKPVAFGIVAVIVIVLLVSVLARKRAKRKGK